MQSFPKVAHERMQDQQSFQRAVCPLRASQCQRQVTGRHQILRLRLQDVVALGHDLIKIHLATHTADLVNLLLDGLEVVVVLHILAAGRIFGDGLRDAVDDSGQRMVAIHKRREGFYSSVGHGCGVRERGARHGV